MALAMILSFAACGNEAPAEPTAPAAPAEPVAPAEPDGAEEAPAEPAPEPRVIHMSTNTTQGSICDYETIHFGEILNEVSGGNLSLDIHYGGAAYNADTAIAEMMSGDVDFVLLIAGQASGIIKDVTYLTVPGFFYYDDENPMAAYEWAQYVRDDMSAIMEDFNGHYLAQRCTPPLTFGNSATAVVSPDDMAGKVWRSSGKWFSKMAADQWGCSTTTVAAAEILTALQRGTVDGAIIHMEMFSSSQIYDVVDYSTVAPFNDGAGFFVMSNECYNSLTAQQQAWVDEASVLFEEWVCKYQNDSYDTLLQETVDAGVEVHELTQEEAFEFTKGVRELYDQMDADATDKGLALKATLLQWMDEHGY